MTRRFLRYLLVVALMGAASHVARADGSVYSMFGIGDLAGPVNGRSTGLGNISTPLWSNTSIFSDNPASWTATRTTKIQGTYGFDYLSTANSTDRALWGNSGIRGMTLAIPLLPAKGITVALGLRPFSSVSYSVDPGITTLTDTTTYVANYTGTGGLSTFFLGSSWQPITWLSVGAAFEYNFGAIEKSVDLLFNSSSLFNHTSIVNRYSPDGFDARVSAMGTVGDLTLAVNGRLPSTLTTQYKQTYLATTFGAADTSIDIVYRQDLPLSLSAGAAYRLGDYLFAAQYDREDWSTVLVDGVHPAELVASNSIGLGVERMGLSTGTGFDKWSLRAGFQTHTGYVSVNGTHINDLFFTIGAGIPINVMTTLDLGLQYGTRGSTNNGLYQDKIFRLNGTLSINELWFQRPE